jgi:hypothetical protein
MRDWSRLAAAAGLVAAAGAFTGWLISIDLDWAASASERECAQATWICFGIAPLVGLAWGLLITVSACCVCMAIAGARPLLATVPTAVVLVVLSTTLFLRFVHGGRLHPAWAFSLTTALTLALFAAALTWPKHAPKSGDRPQGGPYQG